MIAGRDLDILIAEKVFGHTLPKHDDGTAWDPDVAGVSEYSTDIACAWEVVDKLQSRPDSPRTGDFKLSTPGDIWIAEWSEWSDWFEGKGTIFYQAEAETAPHAICLAALKAVEKK